jgi:hypothetical protein
METITAYKLTDGSIVENQREAITKQNYLNFETKIKHLFFEIENDCFNDDDKEKIFSFIVENKKQLKTIFKNAE